MIHDSAQLSGKSKFKIFAVLAREKTVCTVVTSQEPTSLLNKHEKRQCSTLASMLPGQPNRQEDDIFPKVELILSSVGSRWCINFQTKDIVLLDKLDSLILFQIVLQSR